MKQEQWPVDDCLVQGGRNLYGVPLGILMLESRFPRIPGDVGNGATWPFPVLFRIVRGATPERVVRDPESPELLQLMVDATRELEASGVQIVTTGCGFLVLYQAELQRQVGVPVLTSSLLQVPWISATLPAGRSVGVLTIEKRSLTAAHLRAAGVGEGLPVVVGGLDEVGGYFTGQLLSDALDLETGRARAEHVEAACRLVRDHPDIGALVLECTNMPPYARSLASAAGRPVYDLTTMVKWAVAGLRQGMGRVPVAQR